MRARHEEEAKMIEYSGVCKTYAGGAKRAVDGLTWTVPDGAITGFFGPNGAGKSTTLKMTTGILTPDTGTITLDGRDIQADPIAAKRSIGFVSDDPDKFLRLKGVEFLSFMADIYGVGQADRERRIADLAERFEMSDAIGTAISEYSHGMRQKIQIMGALVHNPSLWILDEPLTGLDPKSAYELKLMMREHADRGATVLFSTHVLEVAENLCDRVGIIDHGKLLFDGTLDALKAAHPGESLEQIFLTMTGVMGDAAATGATLGATSAEGGEADA